MKLEDEFMRYVVATILATAAASIAVFLWIVDLVFLQRVFGAMLAAELVIFSMGAYLYYKPSFASANNAWLFAGFLAAGALLLIAVLLGSQPA